MTAAKKSSALKIVLGIVICEATGLLSAFLSGSGDTDWYRNLEKPSFNPPPQIFGPVWTTLYLMMGIALGIVWSSTDIRFKRRALSLFAVQLALNFFWSLLFFRFHQLSIALAEIFLLEACIFGCIILFGKISKTAAWLMVPYCAWVGFASALNTAIVLLN